MIRGARFDSGTARRVWEFARPYRGTIAVFLVSGLAGPATGTAAGGSADTTDSADAGVDTLVPDVVDVRGIVIQNGAFSSDELVLAEGEPAILHVVNSDDVDYRFTIGDLVSPVVIAAGEFETVEFTTPEPTTITAQLLPLDGEEAEPLDELNVIVTEPSAPTS